MITSRNVDDVIKLLKKELNKTLTHDYEKNSEYRQLLIKSIHTCAVRFVQVARSVVEMLLDILSEETLRPLHLQLLQLSTLFLC